VGQNPEFSKAARTRCSARLGERLARSQLARSKYRLYAGAQSRMQEAVQAPAAAQHVPVACVCLQAAPPNAQCVQALCLNARCLTLQSTGRHPASRLPPVISNVSRLVSEIVASVHFVSRCGCGRRRMKLVRRAAPLALPLGCSGVGCPSVGGQRTDLLHRESSLAENQDLFSVLGCAGSGACALVRQALRAKNASHRLAKSASGWPSRLGAARLRSAVLRVAKTTA